ncbi:hypothetical protein U14_00155 [Candidatus Moduliflexus flocculans]|uniref:Uncharacterized protein n=1 Tax=Candidatus Moduliflexus flocculans TaxID=1499966 RepID=A0A0S6VTB9_9BACT|nr:hypothetical protein U14_00155 [Candidatus Moduliflexus flocculans]
MSTKYSLKTPRHVSLQSVMFFTQPSLLLCVALVVFMYWRIPTRIDMTLAVDTPPSAFDRAALPGSLNDGRFPLDRIRRMIVMFPDFPKQRSVEMSNIREMHLMSEQPMRVEIQEVGGASNIRLQGIVSEFRTRAGGLWHEMLRTQFDRLMASRFGIWMILGGWLLLTGVGWIKIYQALH